MDKESFFVVESMSQISFHTEEGEVYLYTDHVNLVYIFDPYVQKPDVSGGTENNALGPQAEGCPIHRRAYQSGEKCVGRYYDKVGSQPYRYSQGCKEF